MSDKSIKQLTDDMGAMLGCQDITWPKPVDIGVVKMKRRPNLLAQIEVPMNYAGIHWVVIDVYGEKDTDENGKPIFSDMSCEINGESADLILPESLISQIASEILQGDHE